MERLHTQGIGPFEYLFQLDFDFVQTIHAADERIPVDAVRFGTDMIYELLQRYGR